MFKLIYGDDSFSISSEINGITEAVIKKSGEFEFFHNENISELLPKLLADSFFVQDRIFIVSNCLYTMGTEIENKIINQAPDINEKTMVVFVEKSIAKKSPLVDYIRKHGETKAFQIKSETDLKSYIRKRFNEEGVDIAPLAIERLSSYVGSDLWQLTEEIQKLILYKRGEEIDPCIDSADVDLLVSSNFEANIFELVDAIATRNTKRSSDLINKFMYSGENAIYILTMVAKQFRNIALAKFEEGINDFNLAKKAGIHPFVAKKSIAQSRNYTKEEIYEMYKKIAWADLKLKSGAEPGQVLMRITV